MFRNLRRYIGAFTALALSATVVPAALAAPDVVVSIAPLHSLVAAVMAGVGEPKLLVPASASPHEFSLRPSDARALAGADIVFRIGADMEPFLDKSLAALASGAVVTLADEPGISERLIREESGDDDDRGNAGRAASNPHIWLSIANARRIAAIAAQALGDNDPANAAAYRRNLTGLSTRLDGLERELRDRIEPARDFPYVVLHDAYSYFEAEFGLQRAAAISISPERRPGARRLREIRDLLAAKNVRCVFAEPQFPNAIAATVVDGTNARVAQLDPLGVGIPTGPELYFDLMKNLSRSLTDCLNG